MSSGMELLGHLEAAQQQLAAAQQHMGAAQQLARGTVPPLAVICIPLGLPLSQAKREIVRQTLLAQRGNRTRTAQVLGIARRTITSWLSGGQDPGKALGPGTTTPESGT